MWSKDCVSVECDCDLPPPPLYMALTPSGMMTARAVPTSSPAPSTVTNFSFSWNHNDIITQRYKYFITQFSSFPQEHMATMHPLHHAVSCCHLCFSSEQVHLLQLSHHCAFISRSLWVFPSSSLPGVSIPVLFLRSWWGATHTALPPS